MAIMIIDPATGLHLREATKAETAEYRAKRAKRDRERPYAACNAIQLGDVMADEYRGPGEWFGGAGC